MGKEGALSLTSKTWTNRLIEDVELEDDDDDEEEEDEGLAWISSL